MIGKIVQLLGSGPQQAEADERHRIAVATCALMLEVAHADGEFSEEEERLLEQLINERFELSDQARDELIVLAHDKRHASVDLYAFTRVLNDEFTPDEKLELVTEMWRLVYSDGAMHHHEEYLLRRISDLLRIPHRKMIAAKLAVQGEPSS